LEVFFRQYDKVPLLLGAKFGRRLPFCLIGRVGGYLRDKFAGLPLGGAKDRLFERFDLNDRSFYSILGACFDQKIWKISANLV
jgi:hypothetical protein